MPGFMKDVRHATAALLIQRSVSLSERVIMATLCDLLSRNEKTL
jgi:hypothetical protein